MDEGITSARPTDAALVAAVADGSEDALAALYDRHAGLAMAVAFRLTADRQAAEDVVQDVFLALWNRAEQFDPKVGSLEGWLSTIARNRAVDRLRAAGRRPQLVAPVARPDEPEAAALDRLALERDGPGPGRSLSGNDPALSLELAETRSEIGTTLARMPDDEREVILLAYRDELTQSEIAERLGWPLGTVKTRTRRALARLREALADLYGPTYSPVPIPISGRAGLAVSRPARRQARGREGRI
jgi:RNA polymerase sigma-70 factor, ECF subfamily